jgi:hypothetical protein
VYIDLFDGLITVIVEHTPQSPASEPEPGAILVE